MLAGQTQDNGAHGEVGIAPVVIPARTRVPDPVYARDRTGRSVVRMTDRIFSMVEVATDPASPLCGRVHHRTMQMLAKQGKLPGVVRIGRKVFVTETGLREFIAAGGTSR